MPPQPPSGSSDGSSPSPDGSWAASPVVRGALVVVALASLAVMLAPAVLGCAAMPAEACSLGGASAAAAVLVAGVGVRAAWLGLATARAVAALPRVAVPPALARAAGRGDTTRLRCVDSNKQVAFCAGLWRPRIYVSVGAVAGLANDELTAVLAHEYAHARRRDPLRALLARACADVAFFAPLLRWWQHKRGLHAELAADRAAVEHAGAPALAGALLLLAGPCPGTVAGAAAFGPTDVVLDARIAALTPSPTTAAITAPRRARPARAGVASIAGVLAAGAVATCLPALVAVLG